MLPIQKGKRTISQNAQARADAKAEKAAAAQPEEAAAQEKAQAAAQEEAAAQEKAQAAAQEEAAVQEKAQAAAQEEAAAQEKAQAAAQEEAAVQEKAQAAAQEEAAAAKLETPEKKPPKKWQQGKRVQMSQTNSSSSAGGSGEIFVWYFADSVGEAMQKGQSVRSQTFTQTSVPDLQVLLYPRGDSTASDGYMSLYLRAPGGWKISYKATIGQAENVFTLATWCPGEWLGWSDFAPVDSGAKAVVVGILKAIPPHAGA